MKNGGYVDKTKKIKIAILSLAIVVELVAIISIARAYYTDSSSAAGLGGLVIGMILLVIGIAQKPENDKKS
jgi:Na+/H+ antiporter NhaA